MEKMVARNEGGLLRPPKKEKPKMEKILARNEGGLVVPKKEKAENGKNAGEK